MELFCVYSTADFRNAFLKTIRQIIRESVRNMSLPQTKPGSTGDSVPAEDKGTASGESVPESMSCLPAPGGWAARHPARYPAPNRPTTPPGHRAQPLGWP